MQIQIETNETLIVVVTPYNSGFVGRCRQLNGKWDATRKRWSFPIALKPDVLKALERHYGYVADTDQKRMTVTVTVNDELSEGCDSVKFGPYELARAWGRDSGAKPGNDVALIEGRIGSGGSRKNWTAYVDAGAVFKITDVPESVVARLRKIADDKTFVEFVDADDVIRETVPYTAEKDAYYAGQNYRHCPDDDGMPEGLHRHQIGGLNGKTYRWRKAVQRPIYTVKEE